MPTIAGQAGTPVPAQVITTPAPVELGVEVSRLDGNIPGTATFTSLGGPGGEGPDPAPGNTVIVSAGYRALSWRFLRSSEQDPGTGDLAQVRAGNLLFNSGSGSQYQENGFEFATDTGETYPDPVEFEVTGNAAIEILVVRQKP